MACQPCWVRPGPDSMGVDQPSLFPLTLPLFSVGDLGGQMGLFIGASILTLLEILDYIYEARNGGLRGLCRQQVGDGMGGCGKSGGAMLASWWTGAGWEVKLWILC